MPNLNELNYNPRPMTLVKSKGKNSRCTSADLKCESAPFATDGQGLCMQHHESLFSSFASQHSMSNSKNNSNKPKAMPEWMNCEKKKPTHYCTTCSSNNPFPLAAKANGTSD